MREHVNRGRFHTGSYGKIHTVKSLLLPLHLLITLNTSSSLSTLQVRMLVRHVSSAELLAARGKDEEAVDSPGDMFVLDGADDFAKKQVMLNSTSQCASQY
jgi:hypothetical protein